MNRTWLNRSRGWSALLGLLAIAGAASLLFGCGVPETPASEPRIALLVSLDTLRADRLGCYGASPSPSSNIDRFAAGAVLFEDSSAASNNTLSTHAAMLTGLHPTFALQAEADPERHGSLAAWLTTAGVETAAFGHGPIARVRSVHDFGSLSLRDKGRQSIIETVAWLRGRGENDAFALLHVFDIHDPYYESPSLVHADRTLSREARLAFHEAMRARGRGAMMAAYDDGIAYVDRLLEPLFHTIEELSNRAEVLVILTSDHGEAMGEHAGFFGHTRTLFTEVVDVPLIVYWSKHTEPRRVDDLATTVDITPTVLEFFDLPGPTAIQGRTLLPALRGDRLASNRFVVAEGRDHTERMLQTTSAKLIVNSQGKLRLYDRLEDPREERNLARAEPRRAGAMANALNDYFEAEARRIGADPAMEPETAADLERSLRALGYVD